MIDSDNRNALDNYGVWVKKSPKDFSKDENDSIFNSNSSDDSQDSFEIAADLPDFSGLDNISSEDNAKDDAFDSGETSLTSEELLNITGSIAESSKNYEDITNFLLQKRQPTVFQNYQTHKYLKLQVWQILIRKKSTLLSKMQKKQNF